MNPKEIYLIKGNQNLYPALCSSANFNIASKSSLTLLYIPNLKSDLRNTLGIDIDMEAGGYVFQMYFVTSQALSEQYLSAVENGVPKEGFRIGFNANRIFTTK